MLARLPVEIILLICQYPEFKDLGQLAWTNKRMMQIIKKYRSIALERKTLFYLLYKNGEVWEGRICLFDSHTNSVEQIAKFTNYLWPWEVATTKDKIFGIGIFGGQSFEIYDLNTRQISRGPDPPEWHKCASVAYFKDKLYYLGGKGPKKPKYTNRVDVLIDGEWQTGPAFPYPIRCAQTITCDGILYVIDGWKSKMIYRLSDDEREWIGVGKIPEIPQSFRVASLNGKVYITGGTNFETFKSCLCFDPSAPVDSRISPIAGMNYTRYYHSLIVANGKLYSTGGFQGNQFSLKTFCDSIEEYDSIENKWREVRGSRKLWNSLKIDQSTQSNRRDKILFYLHYGNGTICLFDSHNISVDYIVEFINYLWPWEVATIKDRIFAIRSYNKWLEIFDLNTLETTRRGPYPPEWREDASISYFKDKLYYLGGKDPGTWKDTNRVDVLIDGRWQPGPAFPLSIKHAQTITCDGILYVIDSHESRKIYRLSDDEREWIEIGEIPEIQDCFGVASLNEKIYITGGYYYYGDGTLKSCLCFDPSAPDGSRISQIADMNYARSSHSLVVTNGKLYAIGGFQKFFCQNLCNSIEEYDPQTNKWREVGKNNIK